MKTILAILITALATVTGAFADQPVYNLKGTIIGIKRDVPASAKANVPHSAAACKTCCAR